MKVPRSHATPTPFGPDRAHQIWEARGHENDFSRALTDGEDEYVRQVWDAMPETSTYQDAFFRVMWGEARKG